MTPSSRFVNPKFLDPRLWNGPGALRHAERPGRELRATGPGSARGWFGADSSLYGNSRARLAGTELEALLTPNLGAPRTPCGHAILHAGKAATWRARRMKLVRLVSEVREAAYTFWPRIH